MDDGALRAALERIRDKMRVGVLPEDYPGYPAEYAKGWNDAAAHVAALADAALAAPAPAVEDTGDVERLTEAAERVLDWVDHHEPWNPSGDFDALYAATGRRHPENDEPVGPRYYTVRDR